jgi:hypothetical protein
MDDKDTQIRRIKAVREVIKDALNRIKSIEGRRVAGRTSETSNSFHRLTEGSMWLGLELRRLADGQSCYTKADDPTTAEVDEPQPDAPCRIEPVG